MSLTLSRVVEELQLMRQVLPADAPVRAWLLSPAAGAPEMAVLEICGVTGGVDRPSGRLCATLQLRLPPPSATPQDPQASADHTAAPAVIRPALNILGSSERGRQAMPLLVEFLAYARMLTGPAKAAVQVLLKHGLSDHGDLVNEGLIKGSVSQTGGAQ
jgi:hypothetical protein